MVENERNVKNRSAQMIKLFNKFKGKQVKNFPVPPFLKWLNAKIVNADYGLIELEFDVRTEMANPTGLLHGGMQCALMDDTIGMITATLGYQGFPICIEFHVGYLGKVKVGEKVKVIGKIIREGKNIVNAIAKIYDMEGNLVSTGNSNLLKTHFIPDYVKKADDITKE